MGIPNQLYPQTRRLYESDLDQKSEKNPVCRMIIIATNTMPITGAFLILVDNLIHINMPIKISKSIATFGIWET